MEKVNWIITLTICFLVFSCEEDTHCDPPPDWFSIEIHDEQGNNLFGNIFLQDSIKLYNETDSVIIDWINENQLQIGFELIQSNEIYFLELSSEDIDTIQIEYHSITYEEPCTNYFVDEIIFNNKTVTELDSEPIILIKD